MSWTTADMPRQDGRLAIVTGANSGIGYETALELSRVGARVIVATRSEAKGREAVTRIGGQTEWRGLDLASLTSVAAFADRLLTEEKALDLLILNAGVMALPRRRETADGFEQQFGTNHLGHFALTARLWPLLTATKGARVVPVASLAAQRGRIDFDDLMAERRYNPWKVYSASKLANLLFAQELSRRAEGSGVSAIAAHPGVAVTSLLSNGPGFAAIGNFFIGLIGQSAAAGALPSLRAATDPAANSGDYLGSTGFRGMRGPPGPAPLPPQARDPAAATRLWAASEELVGLTFRP